ncbi:MAG: hypothetical protein UV02_C0053G0006 [Candidatus Kuenenbacteria bacterium GW2011_GWA2_42_15]|uniref:Uncharacterized protein n=1 Tax=Candidatus Kuenenbacteria bacterium GW2011_GWA2_42_15 TaxID=1618677 RepID=A0A0G1B0H1_9BACT|nr:MAG: hypothetical protein UV02_C0053G0006 [Candidatus Kuenenbacteria bacterium GW2011_GWA2_42_15]
MYADVKTAAGADITSGTVKVSLDAASANAQGQASLTSIDAPSSTNNGTALTVSASALTLVKYSAYGNQTMVIPSVGAKVASFVIQAGAYEGVTIDTINVDYATSGVMQNMKLMMGSTQLGDTKVTLTSTDATDNVFSVNLPLAANESKVIDVYADVKSGIVAHTIDTNVGAIGSSAVTGTTVYHNSTDGVADVDMQTITLSAGRIYATADGSKPDADIIVAGTTVAVNAVKFTAVNQGYTVTKMRIESAGSATTSDSIGEVILSYKDKAGNTVTKTGYLNSSSLVDFTGLNAYVPKDGTAVVTVKVTIPTVPSGADSGDLMRVDFNKDAGFSALGELSNTAITHSTTEANGNYLTEVEGNVLVVRKTRPTITYLTDNMTTVLGNGQKYIASFKVTADPAGAIAFSELNFSYSTTTGVDITNSTIYLYRSTDTSTALNSAASLTKTGTNKLGVVLTSEEEIAANSSKSYLLQGTFTGVETSDSFTLNLIASTIAADYTGTGVDVGTTTTYTYLAGWENGGILWSDESVTGRTSASADYADCAYVKSLPTNSWTMSN